VYQRQHRQFAEHVQRIIARGAVCSKCDFDAGFEHLWNGRYAVCQLQVAYRVCCDIYAAIGQYLYIAVS
jgi:hypothetical protein